MRRSCGRKETSPTACLRPRALPATAPGGRRPPTGGAGASANQFGATAAGQSSSIRGAGDFGINGARPEPQVVRPIGLRDGKMVITLSDTKAPSSCSFSNTRAVPERPRTSGELRSKHNWFRTGRYETRLKAPSVKRSDVTTNGNYIASLFTYRQPACQEWREIDLEVVGTRPGRSSTNLITAEKDCNFSADKEQPATFDLPGSFRSSSNHRLRVVARMHQVLSTASR